MVNEASCGGARPRHDAGLLQQSGGNRRPIDCNGWVHTGDLAIRRADGRYKIAGRLKDMVIRGGENIYPREIEEFLFTHPAVAQAAVFGVPDPKYGEELCVWVNPVQARPPRPTTFAPSARKMLRITKCRGT